MVAQHVPNFAASVAAKSAQATASFVHNVGTNWDDKEKIPILQVLEESAKDSDSSRCTKFMETEGMSLLREWLTKALDQLKNGFEWGSGEEYYVAFGI